MRRLSLAIATILLFSPFVTALPTPPAKPYGRYGTGRLNPNFVGYHGVPIGYGENAHRVDEINHEQLAKGHDVVHQLGHFHDGVRPSTCEVGFCTHGETAHGGHPPRDYLQGCPYRYNGYSTPSASSGHTPSTSSSRGGHNTPYIPHSIHSFAGTLDSPSDKGWGDPHFVGYHGIPVGYGPGAHSVDELNNRLMAHALPPAHQRGHFHDKTRPNNCAEPFCTHGFSADGGYPPRRFGDPPRRS